MGDVVAFESSSLSKLAQSLVGYPSAPVRISVFSRGAIIFLQGHDVELNPLQPTLTERFEFRA